jgi:hypothetical protein
MKTYVNSGSIGLLILTVLSCNDPEMSMQQNCLGSQAVRTDWSAASATRSFIQKASGNPVFNVPDQINIVPYAFINSAHRCGGDVTLDSVYSLKGDCCNALRVADKLSTSPELRWPSISNSLIVAAIFKEPVELFSNGLSIRNTSAIVWAWDSGMNTGSQSGGVTYVNYADGRKVVDSRVTALQPDPLEAGRMYTWCVWAWDDDGTQIVKSSASIPFITEELALNKADMGLIHGDWHLVNAIRKGDSQNITSTFPLSHMSIKLNCPGGTCVINKSKPVSIVLREDEYVDFAEPQFGIDHLEVKWVCQNSISAVATYSGAEVQVLFKR